MNKNTGKILLLFLLFSKGKSGAAETTWWHPDWQFRSQVKIISPALSSNLDTAVFPFTLLNDARADLADLRLVNGSGKLVPFSIQRSPEGEILIYFQVETDPTDYYLYYGCQQAQPLFSSWTPRLQPLTLETREKNRRTHPRSFPEMLELFRSSTRIYGKGKRKKIDDLENPFGPNSNYLSYYQGYLYCDQEGEYGLAINSDDASFLLLDGRVIVSWPGSHNKDGNVNRPLENEWLHRTKIYLQKGIHRIEYYHEQGEGSTLARVGWKKPQETNFSVIPEQAYLPCLQSSLQNREERGKGKTAFFHCQPVESYLFTGYPVLMKLLFSDLADAGQILSRQWKFSDGFSTTRQTFTRVFPENKLLRVTLSWKQKDGKISQCSQTILVKPSCAPIRFDFALGTKNLPAVVLKPFILQPWVASYSSNQIELKLSWQALQPDGKKLKQASQTFLLPPEGNHTFTLPDCPLPGESQRQLHVLYENIPLLRTSIFFLSPESDFSGWQLVEDHLENRNKDRAVLILSPSGKKIALPKDKKNRKNVTIAIIGSMMSNSGACSWVDFFSQEIRKACPHLSFRIKFYPLSDQLCQPSFLQAIPCLAEAFKLNPDLLLLFAGIGEQIFCLKGEEIQTGIRFLLQASKSRSVLPVLIIPPRLPQKENYAYQLALGMKETALREEIPAVDFFTISRFSPPGKDSPGIIFRYPDEQTSHRLACSCVHWLLTHEKTRYLFR